MLGVLERRQDGKLATRICTQRMSHTPFSIAASQANREAQLTLPYQQPEKCRFSDLFD